MKFTLIGISGTGLRNRFREAMREKDVSWCSNSDARLTPDGNKWFSVASGFEYLIMDPKEEESAVVLYTGKSTEFFTQEPLPGELGGETGRAEVIEGTALARHGLEMLTHTNASVLAEAYWLMHTASTKNEEVFLVSLAAVLAARKINMLLRADELADERVKARTGPNSKGEKEFNIKDGDPAVYVSYSHPWGINVDVQIKLRPAGPESKVEWVVSQAMQFVPALITFFVPQGTLSR